MPGTQGGNKKRPVAKQRTLAPGGYAPDAAG
jgi:hypothetical protein